MAKFTKKPEAPADGNSEASSDEISLTLGESKKSSGGLYGPGNSAAARAESFKPSPRDNSPGRVPDGTSNVIASPSDAEEETEAPTAQVDPRENKNV